MDYLFFGINSLAVGISALLLFQQSRTQNHLPLKLTHYLGALALIVVYYGLDQMVLAQSFWGYLLANSLPVFLLLGSLFLLLRPQTASRS